MQLMPETAAYIAQKSGGTAFVQGDLATPQVNISYGSWYLRYLLDQYEGREVLALAAYNAGEGNVDEWVAEASGPRRDVPGRRSTSRSRRRATTCRRCSTRGRDYRRTYARELGL